MAVRFEVSDQVAEVGEAHTLPDAARGKATTIGSGQFSSETAAQDDGGMRGIIA
jgi:hypothetical protein